MLSIQLYLKKKWLSILRKHKAKRRIPLVLDYLEMGLSLEGLDLGMDFDAFVLLIYPKSHHLLCSYLSSFEILEFRHAYDGLKSSFLKTFYKEAVYALVLLVISYLLSWFFVLRFCPSIAMMLDAFEVNVEVLDSYQNIVFIALFLFHLFMIVFVVGFVLFRTMDMRVIAYLRLHQTFSFLRVFMSYRFALNMNLFLRFGIKTKMMLTIMREASVDAFSRWLAYHVEDDLVRGHNLSDAMDQSLFDSRLVLMMKQGIVRDAFEESLLVYLKRTQERLMTYVRRYSRILKFFVFLYLIVLIALFYSVLYLPMQVMEVL